MFFPRNFILLTDKVMVDPVNKISFKAGRDYMDSKDLDMKICYEPHLTADQLWRKRTQEEMDFLNSNPLLQFSENVPIPNVYYESQLIVELNIYESNYENSITTIDFFNSKNVYYLDRHSLLNSNIKFIANHSDEFFEYLIDGIIEYFKQKKMAIYANKGTVKFLIGKEFAENLPRYQGKLNSVQTDDYGQFEIDRMDLPT